MAANIDSLKTNKIKFCIATVLNSTAMMFVSGSILQALLSAVLLLAVLDKNGSLRVWFMVFCTAAAVSYFVLGMYNVVCYRIPYYIYNIKDYGVMSGFSATIAGAVTFALSFWYTFIVRKVSYFTAVTIFFSFALACFIVTFVYNASYKDVSTQFSEQLPRKNASSFREVLKNKDTWFLLVPNFTRGLAQGVFSILTVIGLSMGILNTKTSTYVNVVIQVSIFLSNFTFIFLCKKLKSSTITIVFTILLCIIFPLSVVRAKIVDYLIGYFLINFYSYDGFYCGKRRFFATNRTH